MASSRPRARACASLAALREVPATVAPMRFASCTAAVPTPLPTAWISTRSPATSRPRATSASHAVRNASGIAAASVYAIPSGTAIVSSACTTTNSAWAPPPTSPMTRSPTCHRVTPGPSASTSPAYSRPGMSAGQPAGAG